LYIAIRFDIKFAVPVIAALLHDIVITVGVYSLTGREVSTSTVAAVLTVLGYSIYDTIIIFDRIRENMGLMRHAPYAAIANVSLWETIRRSLATTFITLLPVASLLVFGGATLKDFAFALLVGITSGASAAGPGPMAERDNGLQDLAEQVVLAAVGAVSLTAERVDALADDLAERGGLRRDEARALVNDLAARWRGDSIRVSERAGSTV